MNWRFSEDVQEILQDFIQEISYLFGIKKTTLERFSSLKAINLILADSLQKDSFLTLNPQMGILDLNLVTDELRPDFNEAILYLSQVIARGRRSNANYQPLVVEIFMESIEKIMSRRSRNLQILYNLDPEWKGLPVVLVRFFLL